MPTSVELTGLTFRPTSEGTLHVECDLAISEPGADPETIRMALSTEIADDPGLRLVDWPAWLLQKTKARIDQFLDESGA